CTSGYSKAHGNERKGAGNPDAFARRGPWLVHTLMHDLPLDRRGVVAPELLDVNERSLPLTEDQVLQTGERKELVDVHASEGSVEDLHPRRRGSNRHRVVGERPSGLVGPA